MLTREELDLLASQYPDQKIAEMYGVSCSLIQLIRSKMGIASFRSRIQTLTYEQLDKLTSDYTDEQIAKLLNMSTSGVRKARNRFGVKAFTFKQAEAKAKSDYKMLDKLTDSFTNIEIASIVGWTREYVNTRCKELGVKSFTMKTGSVKTSDGKIISKYEHDASIHIGSANGKRGKSQPEVRKHRFNENYFACIDSEEKAYFLGFILSDGNVYKTTTSLAICDKEIVYLFAKGISASDDLIEYKPNHDGHQDQWRIRLNSIKMAQDLFKLGVTPNKSKTVQYPIIAPELERHLIRGIWDGDGHVSNYAYVCGSEPCLLGIKNALNLRGLPTADTLYKDIGCYRLRLLKSQPQTLLWIYSNCFFYLPRKYNVVHSLWR